MQRAIEQETGRTTSSLSSPCQLVLSITAAIYSWRVGLTAGETWTHFISFTVTRTRKHLPAPSLLQEHGNMHLHIKSQRKVTTRALKAGRNTELDLEGKTTCCSSSHLQGLRNKHCEQHDPSCIQSNKTTAQSEHVGWVGQRSQNQPLAPDVLHRQGTCFL